MNRVKRVTLTQVATFNKEVFIDRNIQRLKTSLLAIFLLFVRVVQSSVNFRDASLFASLLACVIIRFLCVLLSSLLDVLLSVLLGILAVAILSRTEEVSLLRQRLICLD